MRRLFTLLSSIAVVALTLSASAQTTPLHPQAASTPSSSFGGFYAAPFLSLGDSNDEQATLAADFNNDGKPDIASVNFEGGVTTLLNDGRGGFLAPIVSQGGSWSSSVGEFQYPLSIPLAFAADFNGDGYPDLVLGAPNINNFDFQVATIAVRLNQKDGSFGPLIVLPLPNPNSATSIEYSAFNIVQNPSSQYMDIVGVEYVHFSGAYQVLLTRFVNNGTGAFTAQPSQTITIPTAESPSAETPLSLNFADVNHDGQPDLLLERDVSTSTGKYVDILLGNSDGTFQQPLGSSTVNFTAAILDSGGLPDVVHIQSLTGNATRLDLVMNLGESVQVALSNGDGTFQAPKSVLQTARVTQLLLADLNNDGKIDIITSGAGSLVSYLGNGDGTFGPATGTAVAHGYNGFESVFRTALADFNGDGKLDFANGDSNGNIEIARGNGDGTFIATPLLLSAKDPALAPADLNVIGTADLNGDGIPDLLAYSDTTNDGLITAISNPTGGFTYRTGTATYSDFPLGFFSPVIGDFNGDGKQDALFFNSKGGAGVLLSNGDGSFKMPFPIVTISPTIACPYNVNGVAGDINGDGKLDLVIAYYGDQSCSAGTAVPSGIFTALGNGDGSFASTNFTPLGSEIYSPILARFHGSGKPLDLVLIDYLGPDGDQELLLDGKGDGTFAPPVTLANLRAHQALADDFNQDGTPDLTFIVSDFNDDGAFLYAGNGDGTFQTPVNIGVGQLDASAIYADVNGDGIPDLIGQGDDERLNVFLGTGKGNFVASTQYFSPVSNPLSLLAAGKFLGDNAQSLIVNYGYGTGTAFFMNQGGTALTVQPATTSVITGQSTTIGASLTATLSGQPAPTGVITYYDGSTQLGSEAIGTPLSGIQLALGVHQITATYPGDTHFNPNTSAAVTITVANPPAPDFSFTSSATSLNISKGNTGSLTFNVAANSSLSATVTFQCSGLPSESTCVFSPAGLTVSAGGSGSSTLTIGTKAASAVRQQTAANSSHLPLGIIATAGLLVFFIPKKRLTGMMMLIVVSLAALTTLSGCGGSGASTTPPPPSDPGTPTGTTSVTVTATGVSGATTISHTVVISLKVQ